MIDAVRSRPGMISLVVVALIGALFAPAVTAQDLDTVVRDREAAEERLDTLQRQLEDIQSRYHGAEEEIAQLEAERDGLAAQATQVQEALQTRLREQFKHGGSPVLAALLSAEGVTESLERAGLLNALDRRDQVVLERADALSTQMAQSAALIESKRADLEALLAEMEGVAAQVEKELSALQRQERDLRSRQERQRIISRGAQSGTYACIIQGPYHYINSWGFPRSGGRGHKGTDVMGRMNAEVYAFTNGRITSMKSGGLGGIVLYLWGDDGVKYYYAHLSKYASTSYVGKRVEAGELIAYNGSTGNASSSAPHVHFEVHPGGGGAANPYHWLTPVC